MLKTSRSKACSHKVFPCNDNLLFIITYILNTSEIDIGLELPKGLENYLKTGNENMVHD
jgi:hypothetical protein